MQYIRPDVSTLCIGQAASMGALLLAAGAAGKRYALPNARIMIHQPSGGFQGQATDIEIHAREILQDARRSLNEIYVEPHRPDESRWSRRRWSATTSCRRRGQGVRHHRRGRHETSVPRRHAATIWPLRRGQTGRVNEWLDRLILSRLKIVARSARAVANSSGRWHAQTTRGPQALEPVRHSQPERSGTPPR